MSAYGTQKPGGQHAVQLTFPAVRTQVATPHAYKVSTGVEVSKPIAGDDFQALWHEQKRKDAHYMARAKVIATAHHRSRAMSSHMGYFGMPRAVLGQRQNANPTDGAIGASDSGRRSGNSVYGAPFVTSEDMRHIYTRQPDTPLPRRSQNDFSGLVGGVLRSAEGQGHAKGRLTARFNELNQIDIEKQAFVGDIEGALQKQQLADSMTAETSGLEFPAEGMGAKIELTQGLQSLLDAIASAQKTFDIEDQGSEGNSQLVEGEGDETNYLSRFKTEDVVKIMKLSFRLAPSSSGQELTDWKGMCDEIVVLLKSYTVPDGVNEPDVGEVYNTLRKPRLTTFYTSQALLEKLSKYFAEMASVETAGEGRTTRGTLNERIAKSRALVQHLGFAKAQREMDPRVHHQLVQQAERDRLRASQDDESSSGGDDDDSGDEDGDAREEQEELDLDSNSRFTPQGRPREYDEHEEARRQRGGPSRQGRGRVRLQRSLPNNGGDWNREIFGEGAGEEEQDKGVASGGRGRAQTFFNEPVVSAEKREEGQLDEELEVDDDAYVQPKPVRGLRKTKNPSAGRSLHATSGQTNTAVSKPLTVSSHFDQDTGTWGIQTRTGANDGDAEGDEEPEYMPAKVVVKKAPTKQLPPATTIGRPKKGASIPAEAKQAFLDLEKSRNLEGMTRWMIDHNIPVKSALRSKIEAGTHTHTLIKNAVKKSSAFAR